MPSSVVADAGIDGVVQVEPPLPVDRTAAGPVDDALTAVHRCVLEHEIVFRFVTVAGIPWADQLA